MDYGDRSLFEGVTFRFGISLATVGLTGNAYGEVGVGCSISSYGSMARGTGVLRQHIHRSDERSVG